MKPEQYTGPTRPQIAIPDPPKRTSTEKRSRAVAKMTPATDALGGPLGLRERSLELAGITPEQLGAITKDAIDSAHEQMMNANVTQRLVVGTGRGTGEVQEFTDPDHRARTAARQQLIDIAGVKASKSMAGVKLTGPTQINITFAQPPTDLPRAIITAVADSPEAKK